MGCALSDHKEETFVVVTDALKLTVKLEKARRRFDPGEESTVRYRFLVLKSEPLPEDPEPVEQEVAPMPST
jgi:hypothetical protein